MEQTQANLKAATLWLWYDLVIDGGSIHDGIKNEATMHSRKTTSPAGFRGDGITTH